MKKQRSLQTRVLAVVSSSKFFWGLVAFLVLEALWIGLTGRYPMAFDEDFHLGVIRLYAHHISPFWESQPDGGNAFGAVARDPSYFFHYVMSFPYRFISVFTDNQAIQVLFLRAINLGLFVAGLPLYRRLLLRTGASKALVHLCFAVFILIPIVPMLAAQINYDNLLLPLTALTLLAALNFRNTLQLKKRFDAKLLAYVVILCLLGGIVKYAYLPIVVVIAGYVLLTIGCYYAWSLKAAWTALKNGVMAVGVKLRIVLLLVLIVLSGLFLERYGVNMARYHTPVPDCQQVLDIESCSAYGPWIRDYNYSLNKVTDTAPHGVMQPIIFTADWFYGMWLRTFFAVDGPATGFETRGPLLIPGASAIIFAGVALIMLLLSLKRVLRRYNTNVLGLFLASILFYVLVLWLDQFRRYLHTGLPVAINGRYLMPVMLLILIIGAIGVNEFLGNRRRAKIIAATVVLACMLWGGGALTYILRSSDTWYWRAQPVYNANHAVQKVIGPVMPGYKTPTLFMH